jgi:hypothetical protein
MSGGAFSSNRLPVTYRVQDLPGATSRDDAIQLLEAAVGLNKRCSDIKVHSLADDPYYSGKKTATITLKDLAYVLPKTAHRNKWVFDLSDHPSGLDGGSLPTGFLTVDTHFEGFTPLNSFEDDSKHQYEYVPRPQKVDDDVFF